MTLPVEEDGSAEARVPAILHRRVTADLSAFIDGRSYPCLGARSARRTGGLHTFVYGPMSANRTTAALSRDLATFAQMPATGNQLVAMVAAFLESAPESETIFEERLWQQLDALAAIDSIAWSATASSDRSDPNYAFSFAGVPFFVIGLHPRSSRFARRFAWPALVFNPHEQFRRLRANQQFERLRAEIRGRELALQGSLNPNLADAGEVSEARQYSGRAAVPATRCPHRDARVDR